MKWSDGYKIGIPSVDLQHKRLFELIGELNEALQAGLRSSDVVKLITALDQYKTRHFKLEEKHMAECGYPGLAEQQEAHTYFMKRFEELGAELDRTGMTPTIVKTIQGELVDWVKDHVTGLDMEFGRYYQQQQRSVA